MEKEQQQQLMNKLMEFDVKGFNQNMAATRTCQSANLAQEKTERNSAQTATCLKKLNGSPNPLNDIRTKWKGAKDDLVSKIQDYKNNINKSAIMAESLEFMDKLGRNTTSLDKKRKNIAINRRMADFYSQETSAIDLSLAYSKIIYWILFTLLVLATTILLFKNPTSKDKMKLICTIIFLLVFPFINSPLFYGIIKIFSLFPMP
jgi:hypothetical protein